MEVFTFFSYAFISIFTIVNPIGALITFISLTTGIEERERRAIARRAVTIACGLAMVFAFLGEIILGIFNITVDALRVAGGILLFTVALSMMHARVSQGTVSEAEINDAIEKEDVSVFPLAMPLLTGPGTISTVIVLIKTGRTLEMKAMVPIAIILTFALSYLIFRSADRIHRILGLTGSLLITRMMGLLLASIAVNFVAEGIWDLYKSFAH